MLTTVPKSIQSKDEEASILAHQLYQELIECLRRIDDNFEKISRILYQFISTPRLVAAMGYEDPRELFDEPEVRQSIDKMRLSSPAQFFRWKRLAKIDEERPDLHILRLDKLSTFAQSDRVGRLEELIKKKLPQDEELDELVTILGDTPEQRESLPSENFPLQDGVGHWKGQPAIRFIGKGVATVKLMARLLPHYRFKYYPDTSSVIAFTDDDGTKEAVVLTTDVEFLEYLYRKLK